MVKASSVFPGSTAYRFIEISGFCSSKRGICFGTLENRCRWPSGTLSEVYSDRCLTCYIKASGDRKVPPIRSTFRPRCER